MKKHILLFALCSTMLALGSQPALVFIEGNIGAGKSTFVNMLQKYLPVVISLEPCDEWQNVDGHNMLQAFYENPTRWATLFQIYASMTRIRKQCAESKNANGFQMMERSWFSDRYCFARMLHEGQMISELEWAVYGQMWDWYMRNTELPIGFIYLRVTPEVCYQRLKNRNRSEEAGVPLDYLQKLHVCHEQLLIEKNICLELQNIPVLVLDGTVNFRDDVAIQQNFVAQILDFLKIHGNIDLTLSNVVAS